MENENGSSRREKKKRENRGATEKTSFAFPVKEKENEREARARNILSNSKIKGYIYYHAYIYKENLVYNLSRRRRIG